MYCCATLCMALLSRAPSYGTKYTVRQWRRTRSGWSLSGMLSRPWIPPLQPTLNLKHNKSTILNISVRQQICYSMLYAITHPSVCASVTQVDQSKMAEVRIMKLSPQSTPMPLVSLWLTSPQNSKGNIGSRITEQWKKYANKSPYLRDGAR